METYLTITMSLAERDQIARAAGALGISEEAYMLQAALSAASAKAAKAMRPEERAAQQAMIAAYITALGYTPDQSQLARVARAAKALAKAGHAPTELGQVVTWLRANDGRYKQGQHLPLEIVAQAWPAWRARQQGAPGAAPAPPSTPQVRAQVEDTADITF